MKCPETLFREKNDCLSLTSGGSDMKKSCIKWGLKSREIPEKMCVIQGVTVQ